MTVVRAAAAQVVKQPLTPQYTGLGAYSNNFSDVFSATANQASLAQSKTVGFSVYGERRFLLEELSGYTAIAALPTASGVVGLQADLFGSAAFNESQLGILYAKKISSFVDIGAKFNYYSVRIPGYGTASAVNFDLGTIIHFSDKFHGGIHIYNPGSSRLGKYANQRLASVYQLGIGYEVSEMVFVTAELSKKESLPPSVSTALQYNIQKDIFIRGGFSTSTNSGFVAVGLRLSFARIDLNTAYQPVLGFTPGLLLLFNLPQTKN